MYTLFLVTATKEGDRTTAEVESLRPYKEPSDDLNDQNTSEMEIDPEVIPADPPVPDVLEAAQDDNPSGLEIQYEGYPSLTGHFLA